MKKIIVGALLFAAGFIFNDAVDAYRDYHELKINYKRRSFMTERSSDENCKVRNEAGFKTDESPTTGKIGFDTTGCGKG